MSDNDLTVEKEEGDKNFDELAVKFSRKIYGSPKGQIRIHHLWTDLTDFIPTLKTQCLDVLDVGCGVGHFSAKLGQLGHQLFLTDVSQTMIEESKHYFDKQAIDLQNVRWFNRSWQDVVSCQPKDDLDRQFDLVLCHAVLEWIAQPEEAIKSLSSLVKPKGYFSIMFYNRHSLVMRNALRGNFYKVFDEQFGGDENSLTPDYPLDPTTVFRWLEALPFDVLTKTGIRVFYDYFPREIEKNRSYEDVLKLESRYCKQEPFLSLGRYVHVLLQKQ